MESIVPAIALILWFVVIYLVILLIVKIKRTKRLMSICDKNSKLLESSNKREIENNRTIRLHQDHMRDLSSKLADYLERDKRELKNKEYTSFVLASTIKLIRDTIDNKFDPGTANGLKNAITQVKIKTRSIESKLILNVYLLCHNPKGFDAVQKSGLLDILNSHDNCNYTLRHHSIWIDGAIVENHVAYEDNREDIK